MYLIIAGGGKVGRNLTRDLLEMGHEVTLVEQNPSRYRILEEEFEHVVQLGDATEMPGSNTETHRGGRNRSAGITRRERVAVRGVATDDIQQRGTVHIGAYESSGAIDVCDLPIPIRLLRPGAVGIEHRLLDDILDLRADFCQTLPDSQRDNVQQAWPITAEELVRRRRLSLLRPEQQL